MEEARLINALKETAARFDVFDFPLTDFELWQFLPIAISYSELKKFLEEQNPLEKRGGFFFLPGRSEIIAIRQYRYRETNKKLATAKRRLRLISWLPGLRFIAIANIIGPNNLKPKSDIDLFIVTKKNRLWLVKLLATIILAICGLRPTDKKITNQLCLSFLVDDSALDLQSCLNTNNDWYFAYWLAGLRPIYGSEKIYNELIIANSWIKNILPNWQTGCSTPRRAFKERENPEYSLALFNIFERLSKKINYLLMSNDIKKRANLNTDVIVSDHLLKLHTLDRRTQIFKEAEDRLRLLV